MHRSRFILSALFCWSAVLPAQEKPTLAVLEFDGLGISTQEVAALTNRLRTELVLSNAVTVVERGQMEQILIEQDFQMTGCTSNDCAVEVGQLLGVNTMVAGSIGKVGATFSLDFRIIDVASGRIAFSLKKNYRGEIDGLLDIMEDISAELVVAFGGGQISEQLPTMPVTLTANTQPPTSEILLNGESLGLSRVDSMEVEPNSRPRYQTVKKPIAKADDTTTVIISRADTVAMVNQDGIGKNTFVNVPPRIISQHKPVALSSYEYSYQLVVEDLNGARIVYKALKLPRNAHFNSRTGMLKWKPRSNQKGPNDFAIKITDSRGGTTVHEFQVHVFDDPNNRQGPFSSWTLLLAFVGVIFVIGLTIGG